MLLLDSPRRALDERAGHGCDSGAEPLGIMCTITDVDQPGGRQHTDTPQRPHPEHGPPVNSARRHRCAKHPLPSGASTQTDQVIRRVPSPRGAASALQRTLRSHRTRTLVTARVSPSTTKSSPPHLGSGSMRSRQPTIQHTYSLSISRALPASTPHLGPHWFTTPAAALLTIHRSAPLARRTRSAPADCA